jgi:hypothetical protein
VVTFHASQKLKDAVESHARENRIWFRVGAA